MYPRFALLEVADLLFNALGYCLNPLLPLFADDQGNLPRRLKWFQTYDATLDGRGADGGIESRFITQTKWLRNGSVPKNRFFRYVCRVCWLYRNNAYGFAYFVLGAVGPFTLVSWFGNPDVSDRPPAMAGFCFFRWSTDKTTYFHIRWVKPWGFGKCWEANIGWKIAADSTRAQIVFRIWPFRSFGG